MVDGVDREMFRQCLTFCERCCLGSELGRGTLDPAISAVPTGFRSLLKCLRDFFRSVLHSGTYLATHSPSGVLSALPTTN